MRRTGRLLALTLLPALILSAAMAPSASGASSKVKLSPILAGYDRPLLITNAGGRSRVIFIVEQSGKIKRATFRNGAWKKLGVFLDLGGKVIDPDQPGLNEHGLLGLAFHPGYPRNGLLYVFYTRKGAGPGGQAVVAEYRRMDPRQADPASERILMAIDMAIETTRANHTGGHLSFGPDGKLYISVGDGGGTGDPDDNGQDLSTLLGAILRIDPRDPDGPGGQDHTIPADNPFVGKPGRDEIWAWGLRNPWRYSFDRQNGDLWIGDVGQSAREEVDKAVSNRFGKRAGKGRNYGWSDCEGMLEFKADEGDPDDQCSSHVLPVHDYATDRDQAQCSVTGGYVHRGPGALVWRGLYVAGDFCGRLFVLGQGGKRLWSRDSGVMIASFGEDAAGRIFAADVVDGDIYRVVFRGPRP